MDLELALTQLQNGETLILKDGVYTVSATTLMLGPANANQLTEIIAEAGARPVIKCSDGFAPGLTRNNFCKVDGIWFGGDSKALSDRPIYQGNDGGFYNCTFFNYYSGILELSGTRNIYQNNRFVNCGTGNFQHDIYISNAAAASGEGALIDGNIHIGGEGYKIHIWHDPVYCTVRNNFVAKAQWSAVMDGSPHEFYKNIFWSAYGIDLARIANNISDRVGNVYRDNFHGDIPITDGFAENWFQGSLTQSDFEDLLSHAGNHYYSGDAPADVGGIIVTPGDEATYLGDTKANIDAAVDALITAFEQNVTQIQADATIEGYFTTIRDAIDFWKAYTP